MAIDYLCHYCCKALGIKSNELGENKVGRKRCLGCGENDDWWLHVADRDELTFKIETYDHNNLRERE